MKNAQLLAFALGAIPALAQFGPAASSASSLGPAPTESIGCRVVNGAWTCAGPRATAASSAAVSTSALPATSETPSPTVAGASASSDSIPPPPTESVGCVLHIDHYHCEGAADGHDHESTGTPTSDEPTVPSPTESANCMWHETHWDCFDTAAQLQEAQGADDTGECIIHVGHTHGDCSAEQLACGAILVEDYNMPLHIGAVFIILVTSGLGVMLPLISGWFRKPVSASTTNLNASDSDSDLARDTHAGFASSAAFGKGAGVWGNVFFVARHFGTGIILSTAFIHLLFHGFVMFQNECIGELAFESTAAAIALAAAFVTFLFDLIGSRVAHRHMLPSDHHTTGSDSPSVNQEKNARLAAIPHDDDAHAHNVDAAFMAEQNWQVLLLEAGIIFHSIMIGVTLGAGSGDGWTTLLIVIIFHQIFEGMALGARIALLGWLSKTRAFVMGLAFMLITPIGVGIGIGVRQSFSQNGKASLLSVGILNSISAGILLYTAFKLLSADFTEGPLRDAKPLKVIVALVALTIGMIAMSVLGKWA